MSAPEQTPTPSQVYGGRVQRRARVFDLSAHGGPAEKRARALGSACGAIGDLREALEATRRDGFERYVDLNVEHVDRAWGRAQTAMRELMALLDDAEIPAPSDGPLLRAEPPAVKAAAT